MSALERQQPVFIGEILTPGVKAEPITVRVQIPDTICGDCPHPASLHPGGEWDDGVMIARCTACDCGLSRLEAAGWTPPGSCAGQCR